MRCFSSSTGSVLGVEAEALMLPCVALRGVLVGVLTGGAGGGGGGGGPSTTVSLLTSATTGRGGGAGLGSMRVGRGGEGVTTEGAWGTPADRRGEADAVAGTVTGVAAAVTGAWGALLSPHASLTGGAAIVAEASSLGGSVSESSMPMEAERESGEREMPLAAAACFSLIR